MKIIKTLELVYVPFVEFSYESDWYIAKHGGAYTDLVYCDGTWFYTDESKTQVFAYADEIEYLAQWPGFPAP